MAKRPLNIENIRQTTGSTIIGNYTHDYDILQTSGRSINNRAFVESQGVGFASSLTTQFVRPLTQYYRNTSALELSGTVANGGYVNLGKPANLNFLPTDSYSISVWVNVSSSLIHQCEIVTKVDAGNDEQYSIGCAGSTTGRFFARVGGVLKQDFGGDRRDDAWHHIVLSCNGTTYSLYTDGAIAGGTIAVGAETQDNDVLIGAAASGDPGTSVQSHMVGKIDEVSFWDTDLDATDVANLYNGGVPTELTNYASSSNLVTWLRMGDGTGDGGTTVVDQSTGSNNGTIATEGPGEASIVEMTDSDTIYIFNPDPLHNKPYVQNYVAPRTLPNFDLTGTNEYVFVERFNAPGGTDVSSRGVLDTYAEEYAPNNGYTTFFADCVSYR